MFENLWEDIKNGSRAQKRAVGTMATGLMLMASDVVLDVLDSVEINGHSVRISDGLIGGVALAGFSGLLIGQQMLIRSSRQESDR